MPKRQSATAKPRKSSSDPLRRKYKTNYLTQVIAQIQVVNPLATADRAPEKGLSELIVKSFPVEQHKNVQQSQLLITPEGTAAASTKLTRILTYFAQQRKKQVQITEDALTLIYHSFRSSQPFKRDFLSLVDRVFEVYPDVQVKRLGMRFIDDIDLKSEKNPTDWRQYLNPNLLGAFDLAPDRGNIIRAFHVLEWKQGDVFVRFQYGMHNPDHPAPIRQKLFRLDTDAYVSGLLTLDAIKDYWQTLHEAAHLTFESVITDDFRKHLGILK